MRILFMGRKPIAAVTLEWLIRQGHTVVAVLTDGHLLGSVTASVANSHQIPLLSLEEAVDDAQGGRLSFDLGLSVVYWRILPPTLLEVASRGVINFHPAPLPEYRGTAGYNLAILQNLHSWGTTAHYVDSGIDTGPIIDVAPVDLDASRDTAQSLERRTMQVMSAQIRRVVSEADQATRRLPSRPNVGGQYTSRRQMEEMKLVKQGDDIDRKIRAFWFPPYSGASIELDGRLYTLVNSQILSDLAPHDATSLRSASSPDERNSGATSVIAGEDG